jgi:tRNA(Arg) A34 adenosine deaminase TadA
MYTPEQLMQLAIDEARAGIEAGQSPFGCAIARGDQLLACCHNTVLQSLDITAHAEINAVREACQIAESIFLEDCIVASTCEPCPMCMAALHWARVAKVYFGTSINDAANAGFNELELPAAELLRLGGSRLQVEAELMFDDCQAVFEQWKDRPDRRFY